MLMACMGRAWSYVFSLLGLHLCLVAAQTTRSLNAQNVFNNPDKVYNRTGTLLPLYYNLYIIPILANQTGADLVITLTTTSGGTGLGIYCNPPSIPLATSYPSAGYSFWSSELSSATNQIFVSKNDPYFSTSTLPGSLSCTVINADPTETISYTLAATISVNKAQLEAAEQSALSQLFQRCCTAIGSCNYWKAQNSEQAAIGSAVRTDFCAFPGQSCTPAGKLYRLDLSGFNLSCAWPGDLLANFSQLDTLEMRNNRLITGDSASVLSTVAGLPSLQFLDLSNNTGLQGVSGDSGASGKICQAVTANLASLNLNGMGLQGSVPTCLLGAGSKLIALDLGKNNFTGRIPDVVPRGSPLQLLHLQDNRLTGSLPASLGNASNLVDLNVSGNGFSGAIPSSIGSVRTLQSFVASANNLSGSVPHSFGIAQRLVTFDVKSNRLRALPAAWLDPSNDATNSTFNYIRASVNNITGRFPVGLMKAPTLAYLILNVNNMKGQLPTNDSMFPRLRALNISYNSFTGRIPRQFGEVGIFSADPYIQSNGRPLQHTFDVSNNKLSGPLPSFLVSSNVPSWTSGGIFLQGNNLTVDCGDPSFSYLTSVCPNSTRVSNIGTSRRPPPPPVPFARRPASAPGPGGASLFTIPTRSSLPTLNSPPTSSGSSALPGGALTAGFFRQEP